MREIYGNLTAWQCVQVARHPRRPYTSDYIDLMCEDFFELRGDRRYGDDRAILGGLASLNGETIMILGNQKVVIPKSAWSVTLVCRTLRAIAKCCACCGMPSAFTCP